MHGVERVSAGTFGEKVVESELPVLVEFTTTWCPACHAARPMLDRLAGEFEGRARIVEVNVEEERELGEIFEIRSVPTLAFFKGGQFVDGVIGAPPEAVLRRKLEELARSPSTLN